MIANNFFVGIRVVNIFQQFFKLFQPEESEGDELVAAELAVVDEMAGRQTKNGGKGRKRPSLAVSGRGRRAAKRAREPAQPALLEVINWRRIADSQIWDRYRKACYSFLNINVMACLF